MNEKVKIKNPETYRKSRELLQQLAQKIGISRLCKEYHCGDKILYKKLDPNCKAHDISDFCFFDIQAQSDDFTATDTILRQYNRGVYSIPEKQVNKEEIAEYISEISSAASGKCGAYLSTVIEALADGLVEPFEAVKIKKEAQSIMSIMATINAACDTIINE